LIGVNHENNSMGIVRNSWNNRKWLGTDGENIPSFEIFTSPDWRGVEGVYYADFPSYQAGNYVKGVRLVFEKGKVVKASAEKGEKFLKSQLEIDGARGIGEFALTDKRFSKINAFMADTLFDENYGGKHGSMHIALGDSYTERKTVTAYLYNGNKVLIYKDGKFMI